MNPAIQIRVEGKRGCGERRIGGLYLVSDGPAAPCGKLPIPLAICPTCGGGVKPSRGWTWLDGNAILKGWECAGRDCSRCPLAGKPGRVGLIWIGEAFYPRPSQWTAEALGMGVSRRIKVVPRGFELGKTWVWVAHRRAIVVLDGAATAGVFHAFKPSAIEIVCSGKEDDATIKGFIDRGLTPVKVERAPEPCPLFDRN